MSGRYTISMYRELCRKLNLDDMESIKRMNEFTENVMEHRFDDEETRYTANAISSDLFDAGMNMVDCNEHKSPEFINLVSTLMKGQFFGKAYEVVEYAAAAEGQR